MTPTRTNSLPQISAEAYAQAIEEFRGGHVLDEGLLKAVVDRARELTAQSPSVVESGALLAEDDSARSVVCSHVMITPECRKNRTVQGALDYALLRIRHHYNQYARAAENADVAWHIKLIRVEGAALAAKQGRKP